jgi:hypothetical protein
MNKESAGKPFILKPQPIPLLTKRLLLKIKILSFMSVISIDRVSYSNSSDYNAYIFNQNSCQDGSTKDSCPPPKDANLYEHIDNNSDAETYSLPEESSNYVLINGKCYQYSGGRSSSLSDQIHFGSFSDCSDCKVSLEKLPQKHAFNISSPILSPIGSKYHLLSNLTESSEKWISSRNNHVYGILNQSKNVSFSNFYLIDSNNNIVAESSYYNLSDYNFRFEIPFVQGLNYSIIGINSKSTASTLSRNLKFKLPGQSIKTFNSL